MIDIYTKVVYNYTVTTRMELGMTRAREIIKELEADGGIKCGAKGSHYQFKHPVKIGKVTVPFHGLSDLSNITIKSIRKQAGLK